MEGKKPSVLFVNRVYPPLRGATGRVLRDLSQAFVAEGWDVTILTTAGKSSKGNDGAVRVVRVGTITRPRKALSYAWVGFRMFTASVFVKRHDLVVTMTDPPMLVGLGRFLKLKWKLTSFKSSYHIHWCHDLYPDLLPSIGVKIPSSVLKYFKSVSRGQLRKCDRVVAIGRCMAKRMNDDGVDVSKIKYIPNWPNLEIADPFWRGEGKNVDADIAPDDGNDLIDENKKESPGIGLLRDYSEKFRILYAGNVGMAHPMETIMDAAKILSDHCEIEFVFVGDAASHEKLVKMRQERALENIKLMPYQPVEKLHELMESGDVHIVSMSDDCSGKLVPCKFYSAMAVGRPCIYVGPEDSEIAKVIDEYKSGCVVKHGDAKALAEAILNYRESSDEWFSAHKGAEKAGEKFFPYESISRWIDDAKRTLAG